MAERRKLTLAPVAQRDRAPDLRDAVRSTVDKMDWLTVTDEGLRTLALRCAEEIEKAVDRAELAEEILRDAAGDPSIYKRLQKLEAMCEVTKTVGWLGPQLQGYLRDLGGTPKGRADLKSDKPVGSRLAQLRDAAAPGK